MAYNSKDLTTIREMNKEMDRLKEVMESHNKTTKSYRDALKDVRSLSADIKNIEDKRAKINADYLRKSNNLNIAKSIEKLEKQGLGTIQKRLNLTSDIEYLNKLITNGTDNQVKDAVKYNKFLDDINDGLSLAEVNQRMATEHFGDMQSFASDLVKELNKSEDILKQMGKEKKFADMIDQVKDTLGIIDLKKTFTFAGLLAVAAKFASKIFEVRQSLGTSAVESARLAGNMSIAGMSAKLVGGSSQEAENAISGLVEEFGSLSVVSAGVAKDLGLMTGQFGISGANAAKLLKSMEAISGASIETNINLISSVGELARAEGVAPAQVLNDIAESTEMFAEFAKDGGQNIAKAAIEARKLGLNLSTVAGIADNLLDFESSIEKEMEASMLLGKQMSLDKARELALTGDLAGLAEEIKNQVGSQAEFEAMNVVQRRALAQAIGVSAADLGKIVAGEKTSAELAEEQSRQKQKQIGLEKLAANAAIIQAVASISGGFGKFGPLGMGLGAAAIMALYSAIKSAPQLEKGGVVKQSGMAVVHKGEAFSGTRNEMGMGMGQTNGLLKQLIKQNEILMNRLTNKVGDIALSNAV
tara:strand:+ start:269 stop:2026 length:1758 start_codon:yes stop_codon:yes gene_type:complete